MKTPTEFELNNLFHVYDAAYAHDYYLRTRNLKGRKKGTQESVSKSPITKAVVNRKVSGRDPRTGKTAKQIHSEAVARQKQELSEQIQNLEVRLQKLDALIKLKRHEEASEDRKSAAKKERAAKEAEKPKSAAEKAKLARENKKYREKNQQKLKSDSKKTSSSDTSTTTSSSSGRSASDLKAVSIRVKGQLSVAKQKLAAL